MSISHRPAGALLGLVALVATTLLAGVQPAAATSSTSVQVVAGKLVITAADHEVVQVNTTGPGNYAVWVTPQGGVPDVHNVGGVTGDVEITPGAELSRIRIGDLTQTDLPASLVVKAGAGENDVRVSDTTIADDVVVTGRLGLFLTGSTVGDDLLATSGPRSVQVVLRDSTVGDLFQIRSTRRGAIGASLTDSTVGRVRVTGNTGNDSIQARAADLGHRPRFDMGSGNDTVVVTGDSTWTDTLTVSTGNGNDWLRIEDEVGIGEPIGPVRMGKLSAQLGNGDDNAIIDVPITTAGSVVNGQGGFDRLSGGGHADPTSVADYRLFEDVEGGAGQPPILADGDGGDLTVTVRDRVAALRIDRLGDGFRVAYREPSTFDWINLDVPAIDGDVTVSMETWLLTIDIGLEAPTDIPGDLNLVGVAGATARFEIHGVTVGGDLKATTADVLGLDLDAVTVDGRLDARATGPGELSIATYGSTFGRTRINGANQEDRLYFLDGTNLGPSPIITLRGGDDYVSPADVTWTGLLQLNTGSGDDQVGGADPVNPLGRIRAVLGAGDDILRLAGLVDEGRGSVLQGDRDADTLEHATPIPRATVRTFETVVAGS